MIVCFFFFKQKTAYEMRISDWSSDVCSSDLVIAFTDNARAQQHQIVAVRGEALENPKQAGVVFAAQIVRREYGRLDALYVPGEIGRAACRESVGQYV